ncbi:hypothetical protein KY360_04105 [Candidatus Woesearchaeota archaeon]|nr:hypothetical protein [Candidatus Woesearchaeota archaeon]
MEETTNPEEVTQAEAQPEAAQPAEEGAQPTETGIMKLGGGIELTGFSEVDKAQLVVVKKIVGNCVKEMSEKAKKFEKVVVSLTKEGDNCSVHVELTDEGNQLINDSTEKNLFMALNNALKGVIDKQATS